MAEDLLERQEKQEGFLPTQKLSAKACKPLRVLILGCSRLRLNMPTGYLATMKGAHALPILAYSL